MSIYVHKPNLTTRNEFLLRLGRLPKVIDLAMKIERLDELLLRDMARVMYGLYD